ncbi:MULTISPECIES: CHAP domain-containing protein [Asticcacaulis]|uniref:CHAP domain-containing protein n=1 Tax=Asticcacaulis TaxID=76890 RepID=UPI001AE94D4C|nr:MULTISPECIES: CHAP domain-containing protein [Asticcacaulis]MBP2159510.1 surface antigen [Asticcacaulis solisilvae]MDR6800663.1 surface antigen [Asticcacaulis sp. BE141]
MRKILSALIFAVSTLCATGAIEAQAAPKKTTKVAAVKAKKKPASPYLQCVQFARQFTGIQIFGDAWTWWEKATGKYEEGQAPKPGAVLVFKPQGKMRVGHVAVVSQIVTDRYIQITHANWSPINGRRGQVEKDVNVLDVSEKGDWSKVKVWYGPLNDLGTTIYTTYGFIYNEAKGQSKAHAAPKTVADELNAGQLTVAADADELKAALAATHVDKAKPVTVAAHASGTAAKELVARLDANVEQARVASRDVDHRVKAPARQQLANQ